MPDLSKFQLEGCQVLEYAHKAQAAPRRAEGQPVYPGARNQRSRRCRAASAGHCRTGCRTISAPSAGIGGSNLLGALRWAESGAPVRDRNKRSFWLSAARSALFNQQVSIRLKNRNLIRLLMAMRYN
jgi:tRNA pseudouridine13 synthase